MDHFNITIIGAGVVGLAIAEELSSKYRDVLVLEKNNDYGQETSSRNSEVIHAGIYYPAGTMKAKFCREGNRLLYAMCKARGIPFRNTGKIIVAGDPDEADGLREIRERAQQNEIGDLSYLSRRMLCRLEPQVRASDALFSPSTGIIDSHQLMRSFYIAAKENGTVIVLRSEVTAVHFDGRSYDVEINHGAYRFNTSVLINSAGLHADRIAAAVGIDVEKEGYRLKYCRGNYFSVSPSPGLQHLVYPVPAKYKEGLGIHATLDLSGRVRFGPDVEYIDSLDYSVDENRKGSFYEAVVKYLPGIKEECLFPDMSGIRPKLQGPDEPIRDFVIKEESGSGFPRLINLIGVESPGLTSCIPIAKYVAYLTGTAL